MKVLSYVEGILTVISGDSYYQEEAEKPSFIEGSNFYYEPTLKMMDGIELTTCQIASAEDFILNFVPPVVVEEVIEEVIEYYVDAAGNYEGPEGSIKVPSAPVTSLDKWDGSKWVASCTIDSVTKKFNGYGDTRYIENIEYAPDTLVADSFKESRYTYDGKVWSISLADAKEDRIETLADHQVEALDLILGNKAVGEMSSFEIQEREALAYIADNTTPTPFISTLLKARVQPESKLALCNSIITKADAYKVAYAAQLGKFQRLLKAVNTCTTVDDVKLVIW